MGLDDRQANSRRGPEPNTIEKQPLTSEKIGGFGAGGFGANKTGGFGGTATTSGGGSIFGGNTSTAGASSGFGGGFGATTNNASTSSPFGGGGTSGGLFGANKTPAFGGAATTNNSPFGGGNNATSSPFGGGATTGAFGSPASTALAGPAGECQGTGSVPFQPFIEKEPNSNTNQQNSFQSISFQQPYSKFSPEELRLADYAQGRKFGNASGQPGAFGTSTGFGGSFGGGNTTGGFGASNTNTSGGLFGGGATSSPFGGTSQASTTGFGANTATSGGLFGANKPATGGLFGGTSQPAQSTGLFGTSGTATGFGASQPAAGGFGAANNSTNTSLFGANPTASKPFSFGSTQPAAGTTGFGGTSTTGTGFGASSGGGGLFGATGQQNTSSPFGGGQQQQPASTGFGGFGSNPQQQTGTTGLFGGANAQQKPAGGLFGAAPASTGTGLFGGATSTPNNNAFGGAANTQNSGGLFGGAKPAATGGLFGATNNTQTNTGTGGLFSGFSGQNQNQNQQQQSTGLFGGLNNNNQQKPSLFSQPQQGQSSLFGGSGAQQPSNSLFGGLNNSQQQQPQPQNSLFGGNNSLFATPQQGQQTPQSLTASISDNAAYGGASLFSGLATAQVNNPGPIATPLSSSVKQKKTTALPMYKLNSASTSRFTTPQKRGYGFSYSNYGSPASASSTSSTPGTFGDSAFGGSFSGSFGRTLKTSVSTSSLRRSFGPEDSILAPGAFSASPSTRHFGSTGSVKKLNINRSLRNDLFSPPNPQQPPTPSILKKKVSFDPNANGNGASSPLKTIVNGSSPSSEDLGLIRPSPDSNGSKKPVTKPSTPEMEQVQNNELAVVHEEVASGSAPFKAVVKPISTEDPELGDYWMEPSKEELEKLSRAQRQKVSNFKVGRRGVGHIEFNEPVDLTGIDLDEMYESTVHLVHRSATVYPKTVKKPPMGKGLNVPSTIVLENSWPRSKDGKPISGLKAGARLNKHIASLKKVVDTEFINFDSETGIWTFKVPHFTTYGVPEDDNDDEFDGEETSEFGQSTLSAPPDTPTPKSKGMDESFASTSQLTHTESEPEDTFEFRRKKILPGAFDEQDAFTDDEMEEGNGEQYEDSFLDERSVGSQSEDGVEEPMDQDDPFQNDESVSIVDQEMAGSYPQTGNTAELEDDSQDDDDDRMNVEAETPGALARARLRAVQKSETPSKGKFAASNDWTVALKTTISPQKQDRALLKSLIDVRGNDAQGNSEPTPVAKRVVSDGRGFATNIDMLNSLFDRKSPTKIAKVPVKGKGFEVGVPSRT